MMLSVDDGQDIQKQRESTQYSPSGLFGVLTPQANTTAEIELSILLPAKFGLITARLTSSKSDMSERLIDYVNQQNSALDQFANAPLSAAIFACTGAAYLVDPEEEFQQREAIERERGYPFLTAADAVADAIQTLGAEQIGLISPYGADLHQRSLIYWHQRGLRPVVIRRIENRSQTFHPIYSASSDVCEAAYDEISQNDVDCVLCLGTGLPTLPVMAAKVDEPLPILSPNLCLMWRAWSTVTKTAVTKESLCGWLGKTAHWLPRFKLWTSGSS